jgi:ATP-binding cassette, subfamily C, bacterial PrsD
MARDGRIVDELAHLNSIAAFMRQRVWLRKTRGASCVGGVVSIQLDPDQFGPNHKNPVTAAMRASRRRLLGVALFSGVVNLLTLSGSLYMLQVYDRVIPSRNVATLVGLSAIVLFAYLLQGYFDALRTRMLARIATLFDAELQRPIYIALADLPLKGARPFVAQQPLRDIDQLRAFLSGMGPTAFLDMPWIPLFLVALYIFHPAIGIAASLGAAAIIAVTVATERQSQAPARAAMEMSAHRQVFAEATRQNADVIRALGMTGRLTQRWLSANERFLGVSIRSTDAQANLGASAKVLRYVLQSAVLGIGAYLVVIEQASGGIMIASSIMMGRALAPIEVALSTWKQLVAARQSIGRLRDVVSVTAEPKRLPVALPRPCREMTVRDLTIQAPRTDQAIVSNVSFSLRAGMGLAILGPSAAGKSSLARALVGIWRAAEGEIRLDGATLEQWHSDDLGQHLGYLPQNVALFDGTIAENIARFDPAASSEAIVEAARLSGAHEMALRLPNGYATRIGEGGASLSSGQRQRIGLARAVYGNPFLVVLDEPDANLDAEGEKALCETIARLRAAGSIPVVVSHRPAALAALNMALLLYNGRTVAFGTREQILDLIAKTAAAGRRRAPVSSASVGREQSRVLHAVR